eukprot:CAMPEP_0196582376 /NCGR_PEP_ID=MMETSP1081-20130531/38698_1 /TAXON_ID=36882 /ORGANISM="Pyramimonas amylifera, Strain CCMP720" /LENGTH=137 /DNA_ID=CAMNT_0041902923 /DNA_START=457 /DNA_END=867 /DNA_ORIENTATION=+
MDINGICVSSCGSVLAVVMLVHQPVHRAQVEEAVEESVEEVVHHVHHKEGPHRVGKSHVLKGDLNAGRADGSGEEMIDEGDSGETIQSDKEDITSVQAVPMFALLGDLFQTREARLHTLGEDLHAKQNNPREYGCLW